MLAAMFAGCGKDEPEVPNVTQEPKEPEQEQEPEQVDPLELFYRTKTFGFKVKDTANLDLINSYTRDSVIIFLTGRRNEKLWIATFDAQTKEQISEFVDTEKLDLKHKVYLGYGKYKSFTVYEIKFWDIIDKYGFIVVNMELRSKAYVRNENGDFDRLGNLEGFDYSGACKSLLLFVDKSNSNTERYFYENSSLSIDEWYNESYRSRTYNNQTSLESSYTIFEKNGTILMEGESLSGGTAEMAVSYTDYIYIGYDFGYDTHPSIFRSQIGRNPDRWRTSLNFIQQNSKYEYSIISKNEGEWVIRFEVVDFSGEKHAHELTINIETGEIIEDIQENIA
jgi:hypothetical protein